VVKLRQGLVETWTELKRSIVGDEAIEQWRNRLCRCVRAEGGNFEHFL